MDGSRKAGQARRVLVAVASLHGSTADIGRVIGTELSAQGCMVTVAQAKNVVSVDDFDAVIIGSAVYRGRWLQSAKDLVNRSHEALTSRPVWLFSSGPVGRPGGRLARAMAKEPADLADVCAVAEPREHRIFGGKLERKLLPWPQRCVLVVFFRSLDGDFRNLDEIRTWAADIAAQLSLSLR